MNIVFDLGGVVFNWRPDDLIGSIFVEPQERTAVRALVYEHPDWIELDRGTLDTEVAIDRGAARTGLERDRISRFLHAVPGSLTPINDTIDLIRHLGGTDNPLYVLSNMHIPAIEHLDRENTFWDAFTGRVISCRVKKVKPEAQIYEHLLDEFGLTPADTVFIDDMPVNLDAAASQGIQTIHFTSADQCRADLVRMGCL